MVHKSILMNTGELYAEILKTTMTIQEKYPELAEKLSEMPVTIPGVKDPEVDINDLISYYESLRSLLENYDSVNPKKDTP